MAQVAAPNVAPLPAPKMATVTPFITGLKEPQGMAFNKYGNILICDRAHGGSIARFSRIGKAMGYLAVDLKEPSQILVFAETPWLEIDPTRLDFVMLVTEFRTNRTVVVEKLGFPGGGALYSSGSEIAEPMGLLDGPHGLMAVSHATSKIYRWQEPLSASDQLPKFGTLSRQGQLKPTRISQKGDWRLFYAPAPEKERPGFRSMISDGNSYLLSDDVEHQILRLTEDGQISTFSTGISNPSGLTIGPDKMLYVANEGDGGQLIRINNEGEKTVVAEKLGRPNSILFLDAKTLLVSNRDGNIWKIALP